MKQFKIILASPLILLLTICISVGIGISFILNKIFPLGGEHG